MNGFDLLDEWTIKHIVAMTAPMDAPSLAMYSACGLRGTCRRMSAVLRAPIHVGKKTAQIIKLKCDEDYVPLWSFNVIFDEARYTRDQKMNHSDARTLCELAHELCEFTHNWIMSICLQNTSCSSLRYV